VGVELCSALGRKKETARRLNPRKGSPPPPKLSLPVRVPGAVGVVPCTTTLKARPPGRLGSTGWAGGLSPPVRKGKSSGRVARCWSQHPLLPYLFLCWSYGVAASTYYTCTSITTGKQGGAQTPTPRTLLGFVNSRHRHSLILLLFHGTCRAAR